MTDGLVSQEQAIDKIKKRLYETAFNNVGIKQNIDETLVDVAENRLENWFNELPPAQPKQNARIFQGVIVEYPTNSTYPEHEGKPYFLIKYTEDGQDFIGYGTYKPDVLSEYLKKYFMPSAQPETNCSEIPNNSDTISRQAVTKFLNDWLSCLFENCHKQSASDLKMIIKDFKNLPSVQPERPKGEWIHQAKFSRVECDQCGKVFRNTFAPKNFCPNCGADMRGDKHETD